MTAAFVLALIAVAGAALTTVQAILTLRFRRGAGPFPEGLPCRREGPFVSILKPVCGLDDELEENLLSFTRLRGIRYEVVISAEEWADPAAEVARRVMRAHPEAPFRLVVEPGSRHGVVNRKVERLIAALREASGGLVLISDSNVRVEADDVARTVALFRDPDVGCVSNLFAGAGARDIGATLESLHLLAFVAPGAVLANAVGVPCVVGKSMVIRRSVLDAIGGFERFRGVLAEDQAIGLAVREAGHRVVLSPVLVRNVIARRSVRRAADRQIRWNKIRYSFSRGVYGSEIVLNPLPFALAAAALAPDRFALLALAVIAARNLQMAIVNRAMGARLSPIQLAAVAALDLLMIATWIVPFFSNRVTWRGYHARIGRNTEMVQAAA